MKLLLKNCNYLVDRQAKKCLPYMMFIFIISALFDVLGIGMIGAFMALIIQPQMLISHAPDVIQFYLASLTETALISTIGTIIVFAFILKAIIGIYSQKIIVNFIINVSVNLRLRFMKSYQRASFLFCDNKNSGHFLNKNTQINHFVDNVLRPLMTFVSNAMVVIAIIAILFLLHPVISLSLLAMFSIIVFVYDFLVKKKLRRMGTTLTTTAGHINKTALQSLIGLKEIRILEKEIFFAKSLDELSKNYASASALSGALQVIPRYSIESGAAIFLILLTLIALWSGIKPINILPTIGVFAAACLRLLPTIYQMLTSLNLIHTFGPAGEMISDELRDLDANVDTQLLPTENQNRLLFSSFSLDRIYFKYPEAKKNSLSNINFTIKRGDSIGLMGTSGAGKSTLVNIILGLIEPTDGHIRIDNSPLENTRPWMRNFAYIPQGIFILDGSLKNNIALGVEPENIDQEKLTKAIEMAQLTDVVKQLPHGVDTNIGARGSKLSGGQCQRVALARAFYFEREIIIMDEATSALDNETEQEVINSIKALHGVKTLIVVAHRLTTLQYCDTIYRLEKGKIIQSGSYEEVVSCHK